MFQIDLLSRIPIYEQLYNNIVLLIIKGVLVENEQLPSVRNLAKSLSVNPNTVQKAYQELERQHFIYSVAGRGNFVAALNLDEIRKKSLDDVRMSILEALKVGVSKEEITKMIEELKV